MGDASSSSISTEQALKAQIEQLKQENAFMRTEGTKIESQLAKASAQLAAAAQAAGASHNKQIVRLRPPSIPRFKGEMGFECDNLVREIKQMCEYVGESDGLRWVDTAGLHMEGPAATWFEAEKRKQTFTSWDAFVAALHQRFRPMLAADVARERLVQLRQRGSVNQYAIRFQQELIPITDMGDTDQIFFFCQGLYGPISAEVRKAKPRNLPEALDVAVRAELYLKDRSINRNSGFMHQGNPYHRTTSHPSSSHVPVPMDVNAMTEEDMHYDSPVSSSALDSMDVSTATSVQLMAMIQEMRASQKVQEQKMNALFQRSSGGLSGGPGRFGSDTGFKKGIRVDGVSADEVKKCREKGLCIKCKQAGHFARDCSKPVVPLKF